MEYLFIIVAMAICVSQVYSMPIALADPCFFPGFYSPPRQRIIYVNNAGGLQTGGGVFNGGTVGNGVLGGNFGGLTAAQQQVVQEERAWFIRNYGFAPTDQQLAQIISSTTSTASTNVNNGGIVGTVGGIRVGDSTATVTNTVGTLPGTIGNSGSSSSSSTTTTVSSNNNAVVPNTFSSSLTQTSGVVNNGFDPSIFSKPPVSAASSTTSTTTTTQQEQLIT